MRHFSISGMDRETVALLQPPSLGLGVLARLLNGRQAVRLRDIGDDALATGFPAPRHSTRSFLGVPLALPDEFFGVLYLVERLGSEEFGLEDERVTVALAAQGAVAYENARRYEEIQRHSAELQREMIERQRAEKALHRLSVRLLQVQDEERRRIARELHDTTAQNLAGLQMALSFVNDSAEDLKPSARQALSDGIALVNECLREIRTLSYLLHPPLLDDAGLMAALRAYSAGYIRRTGVEVNLDVPFELGRLPREVEITLFRIVQEALGNVHRHSGSKTAEVRLTLTATEILLEVIDQGHGMLPGILDRTINGKALLGVGIAGMQERVAQLDGRLEIDSGSDGTTVSVVLPVRGDKV